MQTSQQWVDYFENNLQEKRIDWNQPATVRAKELRPIIKSLQAWQLGESSDGKNLLKASSAYAEQIGDPYYIKAIRLFIKEEQKHGNNLGLYLDRINQQRVEKNWGDSLFRKVRYLNNSMEWWTLAVISVECTAQIFYQSLKDATDCKLLKSICDDILIDEIPHIQFQQERLAIIFQSKNIFSKKLTFLFYKYFFLSTAIVVWFAHYRLFKAGGNDFKRYFSRMKFKCAKTIGKLKWLIDEKHVLQVS